MNFVDQSDAQTFQIFTVFDFQENDRLKKEGYEKSSKIETLNDKISDLLQSNQQ